MNIVKNKLLINGLTFVTNEYSNTYNRKNMLETYFGGLALKDGTSSFTTTIDLSNNSNNNNNNMAKTMIPNINKDVESKSQQYTDNMTNRLGLSPRHISQTPKPYLSLYNIQGWNMKYHVFAVGIDLLTLV